MREPKTTSTKYCTDITNVHDSATDLHHNKVEKVEQKARLGNKQFSPHIFNLKQIPGIAIFLVTQSIAINAVDFCKYINLCKQEILLFIVIKRN